MNLLRLLKHSFAWRPQYLSAFDATCLAAITDAVRDSEKHHSAQICVMTEHVLPYSYLRKNLSARQRAITLFGKYRVWDTPNNAGILVYINFVEHAVEIVADRGVANVISPQQWSVWVDSLQKAYRLGQFKQGTVTLIQAMTAVLAQQLPPNQVQSASDVYPDQPIRL